MQCLFNLIPPDNSDAVGADRILFTLVNVARDIHHSAGIAPLIIIPTNDMNHLLAGKNGGHQTVYDAGVTVFAEVT